MAGEILYPSHPVLMVDDEESWLMGFEIALNAVGVNNIIACDDSRNVAGILAEREIRVMLLDLTMPHISGDEILKMAAAEHPEVLVIVISGLNQVDTAIGCIRAGAYDYFVKTTEEDKLVNAVRRAIELEEMKSSYSRLKDRMLQGRLEHPEAFAEIITRNRKMLSIFQYVEAVAASTAPVLITGETGVGKELVARSLHRLSGRSGDFVAVNVAGLDDNVFTDTLFGHIKGAFTDASERREGLVAKAAGGTLFLDEIGDLSPASQVKLLRLLQEMEYFPLGADVPRKTDCRVVAATQSELEKGPGRQTFRKDLYYRLGTHHVQIPPLRERAEDLPLLVGHFLDEAAESLNRTRPPAPPQLFPILEQYAFPGNIRELRSMIFDAAASYKSGWLPIKPFRDRILSGEVEGPAPAADREPTEQTIFSSFDRIPRLKEASRALVSEALFRSGGNRTMAAEMLGITRQALSWRLKNDA